MQNENDENLSAHENHLMFSPAAYILLILKDKIFLRSEGNVDT